MPKLTDNNQTLWSSTGLPYALFIFLTAWVGILLLTGIVHGDLSGYDDAVYAHEARSMVQSGDIWTLSLNGNPDFDKPPLFIWLVAISFKLFGINDAAAKLPAVICGWGAIMLVYFLVKELYPADRSDDPKREWLAAASMLCIATTQYFLKYSSHAMTDVPFTFFFIFAIYAYVKSKDHSAWLLASGAATGLALLTRSPMGIFPIAIIGLHLAVSKRFRTIISPYFLGFLLLAIAIPAIWYLREYALFGPFFLERHLGNVLEHSQAKAPQSFLQKFAGYFEYLKLLAGQYWPWFPFLICGMYICVRRMISKRDLSAWLLIIFLAVVVVPMSFADAKVLRYVMPVFPVLAIISAWALLRAFPKNWLPTLSRAVMLVLTAAFFVTIAAPGFIARAEDMRVMGPISDAATPSDEKVLLYTSGEFQWNYANQLLWYGHRFCLHITDLDIIRTLITAKKSSVVIIDKPSFEKLAMKKQDDIKILGESDHFVCFKILSAPAQ